MADAMPFASVAVLGTGLVGGSFGLALRQAFPGTRVCGWDRPEVLTQATERAAIQEAFTDFTEAIRGAELIYIALPVSATLDLLPSLAEAATPETLVTDAGSTKVRVCRAAERLFHSGRRFLGGHPIAGRESSGVENASADLFLDAQYALIGRPEDEEDPRVKKFVAVVRAIGGEPVWCDAETHDWAVGIVSHLPQLASIALARVVADEADETGMPLKLAGRGLQDLLRLAGSPYGVWRDICLTNSENISRSLKRLGQVIEDLQTRLTNKELEQEFRVANDLYKILRDLQ